VLNQRSILSYFNFNICVCRMCYVMLPMSSSAGSRLSRIRSAKSWPRTTRSWLRAKTPSRDQYYKTETEFIRPSAMSTMQSLLVNFLLPYLSRIDSMSNSGDETQQMRLFCARCGMRSLCRDGTRGQFLKDSTYVGTHFAPTYRIFHA
jgi:hypothetical protein